VEGHRSSPFLPGGTNETTYKSMASDRAAHAHPKTAADTADDGTAAAVVVASAAEDDACGWSTSVGVLVADFSVSLVSV